MAVQAGADAEARHSALAANAVEIGATGPQRRFRPMGHRPATGGKPAHPGGDSSLYWTRANRVAAVRMHFPKGSLFLAFAFAFFSIAICILTVTSQRNVRIAFLAQKAPMG
jgi:hypothetical protein